MIVRVRAVVHARDAGAEEELQERPAGCDYTYTYQVVPFGGGEVERRVEAAEGGAPCEPRVRLQQPPHLGLVAVPRGRRQPLAEPGAPQGVAHIYICSLVARRLLDLSLARSAPRRPAGRRTHARHPAAGYVRTSWWPAVERATCCWPVSSSSCNLQGYGVGGLAWRVVAASFRAVP